MTTTIATTDCPQCLSDDLDVVFGHECPDDIRPRWRATTAELRSTGIGVIPERRPSNGSGSGHGGNGPAATGAQVGFLVKLGMDALAAKRLGKKAASDEIERRLAERPKPAPEANRRTNRYAGRCVRCGGQVPAEAGWLAKDSQGRWAADHKGDCPAPQAVPAPVAAQPELPGAELCHTHLTNDESRARGIGPVCATTLRW